MQQKFYVAIDLKSFYASVECRDRALDPLHTHLVVADQSRTEKTICLAVSPSLKAYGIPGRPRLFEVIQRVREINYERSRCNGHGKVFSGKSYDDRALLTDSSLELDYIVAPPRMARYMEVSTKIYQIYLKYVAPEDIHVYSIDEVFMDVTGYLNTYRMTAKELTIQMIRDVFQTTGITATAGIGSNLYLCKVAMDIKAKHCKADENGVRIAELDEKSYRKELWEHQPITDFWRVGRGYARRLAQYGMFTMGDVARCSLEGEDFLYRLFGVNAELLIDHAWGYEPCTLAIIKQYCPAVNSISSGQVLPCPYTYEQTRLVVREMTDILVLDLVDKGLVTDQIALEIGYDAENLKNPEIARCYQGEVTLDAYGRNIPKHAYGSENLGKKTSSTMWIMEAMMKLFDRIADPHLLVRRLHVVACRVIKETQIPKKEEVYEQLSLFTDFYKQQEEKQKQEQALEREKKMQKAVLDIKKKYGKNAILRGMSLEKGATAQTRNRQIGGHKA